MSETFINESKDNQNSSNTNINDIYDSLIGPFYSKKGIKINLSDFNPKLHYKNKDVIITKLYENEEIIEIILDKEILHNNELKEEEKVNGNSHSNPKINLSFLFYLDLLITDDPLLVNYSYPYQLIDIINKYFIKNNNEFFKVIKSKIIIDLIYNFKGLEEYNNLKDKKCLEEIEKENLKILELNAKQLKLKDLDKKKIDQIYADIIESLIKQNNFSNCQDIEEILIGLDLDKIDITQTMIQSFSKLLTENNKNLKKYKINSIYNFSNVNKINFYYFLLKYLFKNSYLVEKNSFLLNTRKSLRESIKSYLNGQSSIKFNVKSKYVLKAILDSPNDSERILNFDKEESISPQINEFDDINNNSNYEIYGTNSEYTVIGYEKTIKGEAIEQLGDGIILCSIENTINIYDQSLNLKSSLTFNDLTYICEINTNLREKDITQIVAYSKQYLTIFTINNLKKNITLKKKIKINFSCSFFLDINEDLKLISGENGTKFLDGEFKGKEDYENDKLKDKTFRSGISIDKNIIALASSKVHNIKGENELVFYNFKSKEIIYEISGYSFAQYPKSLILLPKDKPRILMCPCEKVSDKKKQNGILFINLDILKKTDINQIKNDNKEYIFFYNSKNFKINCFCLLFNQPHTIINSINLKNEYKAYNQYFFAGGDEEDSGRSFGKIYLFKIEFNNSNFNLLIEGNAIDCEIEADGYHEKNKTIDQTITSMLLTNKNENLLVISGRNVHIFKKPNINSYLNIDDNLNYSTT